MEERTLNSAESLELIRSMIRQTRSHVERHAAQPFLVMGYLTVATSIAVWFALRTSLDPRWNLLWFAIPLVGIVYSCIRCRGSKRKEVHTYVDRVVSHIWWVFGIAAVLCSLLTLFAKLDILFIVLLLMGMATALTGLVIRFRLCVVSGLVSAFALAPLCLFVQGTDQCLIFAAVFVVMMVIPGHILDYKCRRACSGN